METKSLFEMTEEELTKMGAAITVKEIKQQPKLWKETFDNYLNSRGKVADFLKAITDKHEKIRVIFTGAGTSAYVGDTVIPYIKGKVNEKIWDLMSIPTTDLVSNPYDYFKADIPTLLVSFARSGNSPESIGAVKLGKQIIEDFYQLTITCAPEGSLAQQAANDSKNLLLLMPENSNDKGFAMTGSYTCMVLTTLLVFDTRADEEKEQIVQSIVLMGNDVIKREKEIQQIVDLTFNRVIYLGSGSLAGMTREASLKLLELTAGKVATLFDSSMGFRHGPKSFVDENTLVFVFTSNHEYTRKYDIDILNELHNDRIAKYVCCLTAVETEDLEVNNFKLAEIGKRIPDAYLALPYVMFAQFVSIIASIKLGNNPDTPSPTGTVNRVVQGVTIHPYQ